MSRFIIPTILILIAITLFFSFTRPLYNEVSLLRGNVASYNEALDNSKALENERDKLTQKYNAIGAENLDKLLKLLPENVDNIRLILEIEKIATPYGMALKDVRYDSSKDTIIAQTKGVVGGGAGGVAVAERKDYGTWDLSFSTSGTYNNFLNFIKDLQSNLRIVDIASIEFSSASESTPLFSTPTLPIYKYSFRIKTYWLKN